ncbi:hypothetical protein QTO34_008316 [Cnephaeus nilssonii]|uniref:Uncharacterized protein n=1 Tax=Cnephaeus nilssonii TaxID=3371016 RepID=A0AA40IAI5_CNENI|nr:hypothetical protein QTO34_008316 [Eptesicus nilssonii]
MLKRKKNQLQPLLSQPQMPKREETGDKDNRFPQIKGTDDSTTAESLTSSPGQRPSLGRLRPQVWPIWYGWWEVNAEPPFTGPDHGSLSQRTETSSKAHKLVTCQDYLPPALTLRMNPRI